MLTAERVERSRTDGFRLGPPVLSEGEVAAPQGETRRVVADRGDASKPQPVRCDIMNGDPERPVRPILDVFRASPASHGSGPNRSGRIRRAIALPMMTEPGAVGQGELFSQAWPRSA